MFVCGILTVSLALLCASHVGNVVGDQEPAASQSASGASGSPSPTPSASGLADSSKLEVLKAPRPVYPVQASAPELQGEVWIKLLISESGDVETTEILSGNPILAKAAADAMKKWKFKPFIKNGRPVKVSTKLPFDFAIQGHVVDTPSKAGAESSVSDLPENSTVDPSKPSLEDAPPPKQLRVSQGVMDGLLVHRVDPVYPLEARRNHTQGTVILQATIGKDGRLRGIKAVSGPPELVEASIGAVEQWRYRPYLLKGEPVEVVTTIKIQFHM